jgi:tRNA(Ile)-lysidine synthase TilS/MesJ
MRRAMQEYEMINENEVIAVGISGGKDSIMLLHGLSLLRRFYPVKYTLEAICVELGFEGTDYSNLIEYCGSIDVPLHIVKTDIAGIIFNERKESNPCSLCSKMKKGALHDKMIELGIHKLAFGHHADDAVETLFLSMLYEGRMHTFKPVTYLDRKQITLIRPMIYVWEKEITYQINKLCLPVVDKNCPADGNTKREEIKQLVKTIKRQIPKSEERILNAIQNKENFYLWFDRL